MKNIVVLFFVFFAITTYAQDLKFEKRFVQSEDKWVAFPADSTGAYPLGFIYIDSQAGLTLDYKGSFRINDNGKFTLEKNELEGSMKYRLKPNNVLVAFIPESKFVELGIEKTPWLGIYKEGEGSISRLYNWGYRYNGWGECEKALEFLEKANTIDPDYNGLQVELAYSYNCLKRYKDAISVLQKALKNNPTDAYTNKELIYAEAHSGQVEVAKKSCRNAFKVCKDESFHAENSFNVLQVYYLNKDVANFNKWLAEANEWFIKDEKFSSYIENMKKELNKEK